MNLVPPIKDNIGNPTRPKSNRADAGNFQANSAPAPLSAPLQDVQVDRARASKRRELLSPSSSPSSSPSPSDSDTESCDSSNRKIGKKSTVAWKKPADKPRRPLSAYNIFFQHEREKILRGDSGETSPSDESAADTILLHKILSRRKGQSCHKAAKKREHVKTHGKIGFVELAKKVGAKWRGLDDASRAVYTALAAVEKNRYKKEVDLWDQKRIVDAELEIVKAEKQQALNMQRIMQGSIGIFDDQADTASAALDHQMNQMTFAAPAAADRPMTGSVSDSDSAKFPVRMPHAVLMAKCRADLAAKMRTDTSRSSDCNAEVETEKQPRVSSSNKVFSQRGEKLDGEECSSNATGHDIAHSMQSPTHNSLADWRSSAFMAPPDEGAAQQVIGLAGEAAYYSATNHDATILHKIAAIASSSEVRAAEETMHQSAASAVDGTSTSNNAKTPEPSAAGTSRKTDQGTASYMDLHNFLSESCIAQDLSHPSFASVDKELTDFLVWAFQDPKGGR